MATTGQVDRVAGGRADDEAWLALKPVITIEWMGGPHVLGSWAARCAVDCGRTGYSIVGYGTNINRALAALFEKARQSGHADLVRRLGLDASDTEDNDVHPVGADPGCCGGPRIILALPDGSTHSLAAPADSCGDDACPCDTPTLDRAVAVIRDLLRFGEHAGPCLTLNDGPCWQHVAETRKREARAWKFLEAAARHGGGRPGG